MVLYIIHTSSSTFDWTKLKYGNPPKMNLKRSAINGLSKKHFFLSKTIVSTIRGEKKKYFGFGFLTTSGF